MLFGLAVLLPLQAAGLQWSHEGSDLLRADEAPLTDAALVASAGSAQAWAEASSKRLKDAEPIAWVHILKAGSSFINSLASLPGVCPEPPSLLTKGVFASFLMDETCTGLHTLNYCVSTGGGIGDPEWSSHYAPYNFTFASFGENHAFLMMRKPAQRVLSAYYYFMVGAPPGLPKDASVPEFAKGVLGFQTRHLTRGYNMCAGDFDPSSRSQSHPQGPSLSHDWDTPSAAEVELAKERLHNGIVFVGITDQWSLSMCLLHAMFGGACNSNDFVNIRPGDHLLAGEGYNESELEGVEDPYDEAVYAEAVKVFHARLQQYNVNDETCQPCYEQAGLSVQEEQTVLLNKKL